MSLERLKRLAPVFVGVLLAVMLVPVMALAAPEAQGSEPGFFQVWTQRVRDFFSSSAINLAWRGLLALGLFLLGWLVAKVIAWVIFRLLIRTNLAMKLADKLGVKPLVEEKPETKEAVEDKHALERGISVVIFYILMLLVVVGVLQFARLTQAAAPINKRTPARPDDPTKYGSMQTADEEVITETLEGNVYGDEYEIYQQIAGALQGGQPYPVTPADALELSRVLDAVRTASDENRVVAL